MNKVKIKYQERGLTITKYHGDNEFELLQYFLTPAHLHTELLDDYDQALDQGICVNIEGASSGCELINQQQWCDQ